VGDACTSRLENGRLPVEELALLATRESRRPRPIYHAHRWFGRRLGTTFRALLTAAAIPTSADFWTAYYDGVSWAGRTVLDPFVGGGTTLVEAQRLGARVVGADVDPVACAITSFELRAGNVPDLDQAVEALKAKVGRALGWLYQTITPEGDSRVVLHYFWVQVAACGACGHEFEAHPHYRLAYEAQGTRQWAFCSGCHEVQELDRSQGEVDCRACGRITIIDGGAVTYGRVTCPGCGARERLIDMARRTGKPPVWRLFATETLEREPDARGLPMTARQFRRATAFDQSLVEQAGRELRREVQSAFGFTLPITTITMADRSDDRLPSYGYRRYTDLFNPRQLLHLTRLGKEIADLPIELREPLGLAFSDHLATNCMLTSYAFGWRRLAPLFAIRAYRHVPRPVEINPWLDRVGRGTFPNAVRGVERAIHFARTPKEPLISGGFRPAPDVHNDDICSTSEAVILKQDARDLSVVRSGSVDLVLTDPPYFDNIAYAELSEFFRPWLEAVGVIESHDASWRTPPMALRARRRDQESARTFGLSLGDCLQECARVLKPSGRLVFTYRHQTALGWLALAVALNRGGFRVVQVFPLLGEVGVGQHAHPGSAIWDAVLVAEPNLETFVSDTEVPVLTSSSFHLAQQHNTRWSERISTMKVPAFPAADRINLLRASLVASALGMFERQGDDDRLLPLECALRHAAEPDQVQRAERGGCQL